MRRIWGRSLFSCALTASVNRWAEELLSEFMFEFMYSNYPWAEYRTTKLIVKTSQVLDRRPHNNPVPGRNY